jgi:hypothetical protein
VISASTHVGQVCPATGAGFGVAVAVGTTGVFVGGIGVFVGIAVAVLVGGTGVFVLGTAVLVLVAATTVGVKSTQVRSILVELDVPCHVQPVWSAGAAA